MIIQPEFPDHWKTRLLIALTKDRSAPMAVIRLWAHCQKSRRSVFPEMTPAALASICHWEDLKPACHTALIRAGFLVRLDPKGFEVHQWSDQNAQLLQKWRAGEKGGRPATSASENDNSAKANEISHSMKPTGSRPEPTDNRRQTESEPIRVDKTRPDQIREDQTRSEVGGLVPSASTLHTQGAQGSVGENLSSGGVVGSVGSVAVPDKSVRMLAKPALKEIRLMLKCEFAGAEKWAEAADKALAKSKMRGVDGKPIQNLRAWLKAFASACETKTRLAV